MIDSLMLGDWVVIYHPSKNKTIRRINAEDFVLMKSIKAGIITQDSPLYRVIEPIILSPELLEVNGFVKDPEDGTMCLNYGEIDEVTWRGTILKIDSLSASLEHVSCIYVHQLQQLLRLCGIGKEIMI